MIRIPKPTRFQTSEIKPMNKSIVATLLACLSVGSVLAQLAPEDPDWTESVAPAPPRFEKSRLIRFDVSLGQTMVFGVDPATITLSKDGVVRYVVVAMAESGSMNAMYEAIRCATGEFKTYARRTADSDWLSVQDPIWKPMQGNMPSRHAYRLARQGICSGRVAASSVAEMVRNLRSPPINNR